MTEEAWIECEVCGEKFSSYGNESGSNRCDECQEEWGDIGYPDRFN